jgi:pilus assembly protein CpaB
MKTRTLLLFVVSIVFGLAAAWMANNWLTQQSRAAAAQNQAQSTQVAG